MRRESGTRGGFTLLEVTFATGILFLALVMLMGTLAHLAGGRELAERRQLANHCLNHCLEQVAGGNANLSELAAPESLPGDYEVLVTPVDDSSLIRITVRTTSSRGHLVEVSGVIYPGDGA